MQNTVLYQETAIYSFKNPTISAIIILVDKLAKAFQANKAQVVAETRIYTLPNANQRHSPCVIINAEMWIIAPAVHGRDYEAVASLELEL